MASEYRLILSSPRGEEVSLLVISQTQYEDSIREQFR